jgi:hypothetical protein
MIWELMRKYLCLLEKEKPNSPDNYRDTLLGFIVIL